MAAFPRPGRSSGDDVPRVTSARRLRGLAARAGAPVRFAADGTGPRSDPASDLSFDDGPSFGADTPRRQHLAEVDPWRPGLPRHRSTPVRRDDAADPWPDADAETRGWVPEWTGDAHRAGSEGRRAPRHRTDAAGDGGELWSPGTASAQPFPSGDDDPWPDDDEDPTAQVPGPGFRAVRHRADRWSQRWVPEPIRSSRARLSGRSAVLLTVVAVVAVLVAGWTWWSGRPDSTPVAATTVGSVQSLSVVSAPPAPSTVPSEPTPAPAAPAEIWVSVTGRVTAPGLYRLTSDARVADALTAAGGLIDQADLTGINLAQPLTDGQSVVVAEQGTEIDPAAVPTPDHTGPGPGKAGVLDLNTADQAALEALPGVGPVMAQAILTWRTDHGPFTSVEQLQEVSGIGPARFAQLAPLVSV